MELEKAYELLKSDNEFEQAKMLGLELDFSGVDYLTEKELKEKEINVLMFLILNPDYALFFDKKEKIYFLYNPSNDDAKPEDVPNAKVILKFNKK